MKNKVKIIMSQPKGHKWEFIASSFELGFIKAVERYERMGLIGKCYVIGSDGSHKIIN